jgi:hypothetical protein
MRKLFSLLLALGLTIAACGGSDSDGGAEETAAPSVTEATVAEATTTIAAPTTTTTVAPDSGFAAADLPIALLQDGDPWVVAPAGVVPIELSLDDIWPLQGALQFPDERAVYEASGFQAGAFAFFADAADSLLITGAHLFDDSSGAAAALAVIQQSFSDPELIAAITSLPPGSLTAFELFDPGEFGDQAVGVRLTGDTTQVVGVVWITNNVLQFVRTAMPLDDAAREAASLAVATAMAARLGG